MGSRVCSQVGAGLSLGHPQTGQAAGKDKWEKGPFLAPKSVIFNYNPTIFSTQKFQARTTWKKLCFRYCGIEQESISSYLADALAGKPTGNPQRDYPDLLTNREAWNRITYFKY